MPNFNRFEQRVLVFSSGGLLFSFLTYYFLNQKQKKRGKKIIHQQRDETREDQLIFDKPLQSNEYVEIVNEVKTGNLERIGILEEAKKI